MVSPWPCSLSNAGRTPHRPPGVPFCPGCGPGGRGLCSQQPGRWPHAPGPLPAIVLLLSPCCPSYPSPAHADTLQACLRTPILPATGLSLWAPGTKGRGGWGPSPGIFCCASSLWLTFPTFLDWKAQVAQFPFIFLVSGSNVTSSEATQLTPPFSSVTVCHGPYFTVIQNSVVFRFPDYLFPPWPHRG